MNLANYKQTLSGGSVLRDCTNEHPIETSNNNKIKSASLSSSSSLSSKMAIQINSNENKPMTTKTFDWAKKVKPNESNPYALTGRWTKTEQLAFLYGLRMYGSGKWKSIAKMVPTRDNIQVKSRAQRLLKLQTSGIPIFADLDQYMKEQKHQSSASITPLPNNFNRRKKYNYPVPYTSRQFRSPCDVLEAACGLALLEDAPRHLRTSNNAMFKVKRTTRNLFFHHR